MYNNSSVDFILVLDPSPGSNHGTAANDGSSMDTSTTRNDGKDKGEENQQPIQREEDAEKPVVAKRRRGVQIASDSEDDEDGDSLKIDESYQSPLKESRNSNKNSLETNTNEDGLDDDESLGNSNRTSTGTKRRSAMLNSDDNSEEEKENQPKKARVEETVDENQTKENVDDDEVGKILTFLFQFF